MQKLNLGKSEVAVLKVMSDLEWWTITRVQSRLMLRGARQAMQRLYARKLLDRVVAQHIGAARAIHRTYHAYRLNAAGLEVVLK